MKKPSKKKELLISGIAGVVLLTGGVVLAIYVIPNGVENFVYKATGVVLDVNGDGQTAANHVVIPMDTDDAYGPRTGVGLGGYEDFAH